MYKNTLKSLYIFFSSHYLQKNLSISLFISLKCRQLKTSNPSELFAKEPELAWMRAS